MGRSIRYSFSLATGISLLAWILGGCATTKPVNWEGRVGEYTFDDAVLEMGPPDKAAELTDGTKVTEWTDRSPRSGVFLFGFWTGYHRQHRGTSLSQTSVRSPYESYLRLTFDPQGILKEWSY